jgi:hypothetical protein
MPTLTEWPVESAAESGQCLSIQVLAAALDPGVKLTESASRIPPLAQFFRDLQILYLVLVIVLFAVKLFILRDPGVLGGEAVRRQSQLSGHLAI